MSLNKENKTNQTKMKVTVGPSINVLLCVNGHHTFHVSRHKTQMHKNPYILLTSLAQSAGALKYLQLNWVLMLN